MSVAVWDSANEYRDIGAAHDAVTEALRDFANWIYRQLEAEYEYVMSDENVDESITINEYEFTGDGARLTVQRCAVTLRSVTVSIQARFRRDDMAEVITRKEFWVKHDALWAEHKDDREAGKAAAYALHREYWGAYVQAFKVRAPDHLLAACRKAIEAGDEYMNSPYTTLQQWDALMDSTQYVPGLIKALRENGEGWSPSVNICLRKEAMRQRIERETANGKA